MDTYTPKERCANFTKNEKDRFRSLIEKYKNVLFCKKTDNNSNLRKNRTWAAIYAEFNACGKQPRSLRQLKAKFDNMKRTARKDASQEAEVLKKSIEQGDYLYQLQIKHMEQRRKEEKTLHEQEMQLLEMKKKKLLLEICVLESN